MIVRLCLQVPYPRSCLSSSLAQMKRDGGSWDWERARLGVSELAVEWWLDCASIAPLRSSMVVAMQDRWAMVGCGGRWHGDEGEGNCRSVVVCEEAVGVVVAIAGAVLEAVKDDEAMLRGTIGVAKQRQRGLWWVHQKSIWWRRRALRTLSLILTIRHLASFEKARSYIHRWIFEAISTEVWPCWYM